MRGWIGRGAGTGRREPESPTPLLGDSLAIGSGGTFALAAARALISTQPKMTAEEIVEKALSIAADICVYTNKNITVETI